jgi:hypothetical protein
MATGPRLLVLTARRQDLTPEQYKHHYEEIHIPLLRRLLGDAFPFAQERHYIPRSTDGGSLQSLIGSGDVAFDCITISVFADEEHLQRAVAESNDTKKKAVREEDEAKFLDTTMTKMMMVDSKKTCTDERLM